MKTFGKSILTCAITLGMHVRVGLEDSLGSARKILATSNAEQIARARQVLDALSIPLATPGEARSMLQIKGADRRNF